MTETGNIAARATAFVEWFLPQRIRTGEAGERGQARLFVAYTTVLVLMGCPYAAFYYGHGSHSAAVICILASAIAPTFLLLMRYTGSVRVGANLGIGLLYACLTALALCLGGTHAPSLLWYAAIPLIAMSLAGRHPAIAWTAVATASLMALLVVEQMGFAFQDDLTQEGHRLIHATVLVGVIVLVLLLAILIESFKERAFNEMRREKAFSEHVVNGLPGVFYLFDAQGRFVRWNRNFQRVTGYSDQELATMQPWDFFQGDDRQLIATAVQKVFEAGEATAEAGFTSKGGQTAPYFFTGLLANLEGRPHLLGMGVDIRERKQAERTTASLYELNGDLLVTEDLSAKLQRITKGVVEILEADFARIWVTKPGDRCDDGCVHAQVSEGPHVCRERDRCLHLLASAGRYTHLDGEVHRRVPFGCCKIGRVASGEDAGFITNDVTHDPRVHNHEWAAQLGLASFAGYRLVSAEREPIGVLALFSKRRISNDDDMLLGTIANTTSHVIQRARAEEAVRHHAGLLQAKNEQLEAQRGQLEVQGRELIEINTALEAARQVAETATKSKSEFLANMSHEIRTPMTAILGFADLLLEQGDSENVPAHRLEATRTIKRNGEHLLGVINDILDISKIEAGKMTAERVPCSPCQIVAEVVSLMRVRCDAKGLELNVEYEGAIPETVHTDPLRLRQILVNVLGNAIKFTEQGSVRFIGRLDSNGNPPALQFDVVDQGIGMTFQQVEQLFTPFAQADASTTRKHGGTGLGLTISKRLATMLDGDVVVVETAPGVGTRVRVTVGAGPLVDVNMLEDPAAATTIAPGNALVESVAVTEQAPSHRILLAEDGPDNQRLIAHILRKAGADVTIVENGKLAVDAALAARGEGAPYDVILMDMQMPELDGYQATRTLRSRGYTGAIIALTAHAMSSDRQKCLDAGCDDYASKPVNRKKLIETIQSYLRHAHAATNGVSA